MLFNCCPNVVRHNTSNCHFKVTTSRLARWYRTWDPIFLSCSVYTVPIHHNLRYDLKSLQHHYCLEKKNYWSVIWIGEMVMRLMFKAANHHHENGSSAECQPSKTWIIAHCVQFYCSMPWYYCLPDDKLGFLSGLRSPVSGHWSLISGLWQNEL